MYEALTRFVEFLFSGPHSADWWGAAFTGILAVAAVVAGAFALRQLRETESGREAQLLPIVQFKRVALLPATETHKFVELTLANFGPGPAIDVECRVWIVPAEPDAAEDAIKLAELIQGLQTYIEANPPAGHAALQGLGAGEVVATYLLKDGQILIPCAENCALVVVAMTFEDAFGTKFRSPEPSKPGRMKSTYRFALLEDRLPSLN